MDEEAKAAADGALQVIRRGTGGLSRRDIPEHAGHRAGLVPRDAVAS